ncbi:TolB family protein [Metabacillus fastidiosus]|uniref:TolB family protein n=1 Tax=Metabacillus fastidiosus TaxID=1458 RepID=UPI003D2C3F03
MKNTRNIVIWIWVVAILFLTTLTYNLLQNNDQYKYFTGLGSHISVSPDDSAIAFSYFINGKEAIYTSNIDGTNIKRVTGTDSERHHEPKFSADGKKLLYLSENSTGIQSIHIINRDGTDSVKLTDNKSHVEQAIFSPAGDKIYYIAMSAKDFGKMEGETQEGLDLFSLSLKDGKQKQLTNKDHFSMNSLFISKNGNTIFYTEFDGQYEKLRSLVLNDSVERLHIPEQSLHNIYNGQLSADESKLAYTDVSPQSTDSFEYELFLNDLKTKKTEQLTKLKKSISSPVFFHHSNKIAFLKQTNWPAYLAEYELNVINTDDHKIKTVPLKIKSEEKNLFFIKTLDLILSNTYTIAGLYLLLLGLLTVYFHKRSRKAFLPGIISISLAILAFISSFIVSAITNPWIGIAIGMIALALFICSIIILAFAFFFKRFAT